MFIKIFTPNENGKIELTIEELETLLQEAVDKASVNKCNKCIRGWSWTDYNRVITQPNITLLSDDTDRPRRNGEITWNTKDYTTNTMDDLSVFRSPINGQLNFDFDNTKEN